MSVFEIIGEIGNIEIIAVGSKIRDIEWLRKTYGSGRWRKLKGFARFVSLTTAKNFKPNSIGMKRTGLAKWK